MSQQRARSIAVLVLVVIAVAVGGGAWWMSGGGERAAKNACYEAVKAKIGQPGSAVFAVEYAGKRDGTWMVAGHVDADRRYRFDCNVTDGKVASAFVA